MQGFVKAVAKLLPCCALLMALSSYAIADDIDNGEKIRGNNMTTSQDTSFLDKITAEEGVVTLPSGLRYKILTAGTGEKPTASNTVTVNYEGKLENGTVFDSSYKRGQPASFGVSDVISGWTEALQLMSVGSVWELYIPADLAYGARGVPGVIPANSVLIFKVELLAIN